MTRLAATALALLLGLPAQAQEVSQCDHRAHADGIPEPWEANTRSFANGEVRVALIDRIEPAAGAFYLLILHPPRGVLGERRCSLVGFGSGMGYAALDFAALTAGYDPARGLTLSLPGRLYLPEEGFTNSLIIHATVNQATGQVTANHELGRE
ncbi:hypothetical protein [Marimonas lutisalis]|uniref:hypothetical protein n=1 Tax=Marimonas lutisalis TaxID=2545756 RepID=UPI0010F4BF6D|nr:hypothetical protein [Marimonas lutisalis]